MRNNKTLLRLTAFSLLGFAHWFFGNLYETIVLSPNILLATSKLEVLENIRDLFHISAPYYYFLPWSPISILLVVILYGKAYHISEPLLRKWAASAMYLAIAAGVVTYFIITKYNVVLWIGNRKLSEDELQEMILANFFIGNLRLILILGVLYCLYKCLLIILKAIHITR
jgi:hypothetical protein